MATLHLLISCLYVRGHRLIYLIIDGRFWLFWRLIEKIGSRGISFPKSQLADIRIGQFFGLITDKFLSSLNHMSFPLLLFLLLQLSLPEQLLSLLLIVLLLWFRDVAPEWAEHLAVYLMFRVLLNEVGVLLLLKERGCLLYLLLGDGL